MPKIIAVVGPIGYGKYTKGQEIVAANPKYELSTIEDEWKSFKSLCLGRKQKHPGHTLVVTNGGSLFFHNEKKYIRITITEVYGPQVLIDFLSKFRKVDLTDMCHEDFINTDYWKNAYGMMTDESTPCGKRFRAILNQFNDIIEETCDQRIKDGTFKLRSPSSSSTETSSSSTEPSSSSTESSSLSTESSSLSTESSSLSTESSGKPEVRSQRHQSHKNYLFDSLGQSIAELSHYCEKNIKYQLCLIMWAQNRPQIKLNGY